MSTQFPARIDVIDSHTAGEPTRCVISGAPDLGSGTVAERLQKLRGEYDFLRRAVLCEPRGSDVLVGALLLEPFKPSSAAAVIFFNNAGYLGMCGHGMIGVAATLAHLGRIQKGEHQIETPVGTVSVRLVAKTLASVRNVPAYRHLSNVKIDVPGYGPVVGDVAWGGNWFFLTRQHSCNSARELVLSNVERLTAFTWDIRRALRDAGVTGSDGAEIDHIELFSDPCDPANNSRNFVLCPGKAYDRSPCGTGTSAKMACLAADGLLAPGQLWRQEGILGTVFEGTFDFESEDKPGAQGRRIRPEITGSAYVTANSSLIFAPDDPFRFGVPE